MCVYRSTRQNKGLALTLWLPAVLMLLSVEPNGARAFQAQDDEKLRKILATISKTSTAGLKILSRIQELKPEVNGVESSKTLIDIVQDYAFNKGAAYNIIVIGWAASRKELVDGEPIGRWRIVLYYKDWQKQYQSAEWEYNDETDKLYPFETENAPGFFSLERPVQKKRNK